MKRCRVITGYALDKKGMPTIPKACDKPAVHEIFGVPYCKEHWDKKKWE